MTIFRMEQPLPGVMVTRELVRSIEALILKQISALATNADDPGELRAALRVSVSDSLGTESMQSIDDYGPSKFPDTSKEIEIRFSAPWRSSLRGLEICIQFHKSRHLSRAKISIDRANARELAHGIATTLNECIEPHRTSSEWLHPRPFISGVVFAITWTSFWFASMAMGARHSTLTLTFGLSFLLLVIYQWILPSLRPYTSFDSRSADNRSKWFDWLVKGLLGFVLFGTLLAIVRDQILKHLGMG